MGNKEICGPNYYKIDKTPIKNLDTYANHRTNSVMQNINRPIINIDNKNKVELQNLASNLKKFNLPNENATSFKKSLLNSGIDGVKDLVRNIKNEDIKNFIIIVSTIAPLLICGVGVVAAVSLIGARIGASQIMMRVATEVLRRPNTTSFVCGLIPGMKNIAPNKGLAMVVSELKHVLPGVFGTVAAKSSEILKKR